MKKSTFRLKVSILSAFLVFFSFSIFFLIENFFWLNLYFENLDSNFFIGRIFISLSFSFLVGLLIYIFTNNFYESLRAFSHKLQVWARTLETPKEDPIHLKIDSEIIELESQFQIALEANKKREQEKILKSLELNNANIAENLKPFIPELKTEGLEFLEVSVFPSNTSSLEFDFISVIEVEIGYILLLCGFEKTEILQSIYKYKLSGIVSALQAMYYLKEEEILKNLELIFMENFIEDLRFSLHFVPNTANHFASVHFQKIPIIHLSDSGVTYIQSEEIYLKNKIKFHKSIISNNSYLLIISDKILDKLKIPLKEFNSILESEIFSRPIYQNSKELIYRVTVLIDKLGRERGIESILNEFYSISLKKK